MAIKEYIYLLGVEDVEASLKRLSDQGEQALGQFRELGGTGATQPFGQIAEGTKEAADATEDLTLKAHDLRTGMYVLRPILQAAGIEIGQFASLGRLAGVGLAGIAAAAAGAVVVGLARLEDAARTTKGQLEDLFQSKALSEKAFAGIQTSAQQFNTTVASIAPGIEALKTAWERFITETRTFKFVAPTGGASIGQIIPPGMVGSVESLQAAYDNFLKLLRAGRLDQANAAKAAEAFFTAMQNGGKLTSEILRNLPVGTVNLLAQAMGRGQISTQQFINEVKLAPINLDKLVEALGRFGAESDKAFRANAIRTYTDALGDLWNEIERQSKRISGFSFSDFVVAAIDKIRAKIKEMDQSWDDAIIAVANWDAKLSNLPGVKQLVDFLNFISGQAAAAEKFGGAFGGTADEITKVWTTAAPKIADALQSNFKSVGDKLPKNFFEPLDKSLTEFQAKNKETIDRINQALDMVPQTAKEIGKDLTDSLSLTGPKGILPSWQEFLNLLKDISPISRAHAAEFTPTPLLQQQQQVEETQPMVAPFQEADNQIRTIWIALMDYISTSVSELDFTPLTQALVAPFTNALPGIRDALLQVEQMIREIIRQALEAGQIIQQLNQGGRPGGGGGGFSFQEVASGGYIRGPGTTTSDSIPAWLSNREYVIQARAVDHYGPNLFAALNSMRLPKDLFSHFAIGGLAKALSNAMPKYPPRYATGGMATASARRSLTIVLDGQKFGVSGSNDVIDRLERVATMAGIASVGRPPGWVR